MFKKFRKNNKIFITRRNLGEKFIEPFFPSINETKATVTSSATSFVPTHPINFLPPVSF